MRTRLTSFGDFRCAHCHVIVSSDHQFSGVNNRNHCPYCLWSCHLDLFGAGDRLSACKAPMDPIGVTMKKSKDKYQHLETRRSRGELMLIHQCVECQALSINRIAADDNADLIMAVFEKSLDLDHQVRALCQENGIVILNMQDTEIVRKQLYGHDTVIPALSWV